MRTSTCLSCGAVQTGRYCAECGERRLDPDDLSLARFVRRSFASVFDLDSRFWRSFVALVSRPGLLTREWLDGRRKPWLAPIQVFLFANLAYFLSLFVVGWNTFTTPLRIHMTGTPYGGLATRLVERRLADGTPHAEYEAAFDILVEAQARTLLILIVPLFALVVWALHARLRRPFVPHLVFALHGFAFFLLLVPPVLFAWGWLVRLWLRLGGAGPQHQDLVVSLLLLTLWGTWLYLSARRVYGQAPAPSALKAAVMAGSLFVTVTVYRLILFFTTWLAV